MTLKPVKTDATYQDLLNAPDDMRAELIDGNLYLQPAPRVGHQDIVTRLGGALSTLLPAEDWVILAGVEIHIPYTLVPDIAGWRAERFVRTARDTHIDVVPDWVCEVHSPSTRGYDRGIKRQKYLDRGVPWLWLLEPEDKTIEIFHAQENHWGIVRDLRAP